MRRLLAALVLLLLLFAAPMYLLFTGSGARLLLEQASKQPGLSLQYGSGSIARGLRLGTVAWAQGKISVAARGVSLTPLWSADCLLRSTLCLRSLAADAVSLGLPAADEGAGTDWTLPEDLRLPLRISVESVSVAEINVRRGELEQKLNDIHASLRLRRRGVELDSLALSSEFMALKGSLRLFWTEQWPLFAKLQLAPQPDLLPDGVAERWKLLLDGPLRDLDVTLAPDAEAGPALSGALRLPTGGPILDASLSLSDLEMLPQVASLAPWLVLDAPVSAELSIDAERQVLTLHSSLVGWAEEPLSLQAELLRTAGKLDLRHLRLQDQDGAVRFDSSGQLLRADALAARLQFRAEQLTPPVAPELPLQVLNASGQLALDSAEPAVDWSLTDTQASLIYDGRTLQLSGSLARAPDHALLALGELSGVVDGRTVRYRRTGAGAPAQLRLPEGISAGEFSLSDVEATLQPGTVDQLSLSLAGDAQGTLQLALTQRSDGAALELQPFRLRLREEIVHSNDTVTGRWLREAGALALDPWCLQLRGLSLCGDEARIGASGSINIQLAGEERLTNSLSGDPYSIFLQGEGELRLAWSPEGLGESALDLDLSQFNIDPFLGAGTAPPVAWENVQLRATSTSDAQQVRLTADSTRLGSLRLDGARQPSGEIAGELELDSLYLPAFNDLLPELVLDAGTLEGAITISGTLSAPFFDGRLQLMEGAATLESQGVGISAANITLAGSNDAFTIDGSAVLGEGPVKLQGICCEGDALELRIAGDRNRLRLPVGLDALVTPDFTLSINSTRARFGGELRVHDGVLEHRGVAAEGVSVSADVVRLDEAPASPRRFLLDTDIRTIIEPGFTLRSTQLEATLGGDLRFAASSEQPAQLYGDLQVLGGELRAYGQVLRIDRGSVGFVGDPLNPDLSLSAVRDIRSEQLRVGVRVQGTLDAPQLSMFSDPQRSERETLSYLLRGRGPDAGAGADGTAMAMSLGASALNQSGLLETLNSVPGLSQVSIGAEGSDDETAATISAYVGERLFLSYGMGIYEPVNALTARLYLRSRLWLEVVSRLESSFDLYYRFDVD